MMYEHTRTRYLLNNLYIAEWIWKKPKLTEYEGKIQPTPEMPAPGIKSVKPGIFYILEKCQR